MSTDLHITPGPRATNNNALDALAALLSQWPQAFPALLVNVDQCAWLGARSVSWWNQAVREGRAPKPVFRGLRCTRWRLATVLAFWLEAKRPGAAKA